MRDCGPVAVVSGLCLLVLLTQLDPAGDFANATQGPGLTLDEIYNVAEGVRLVRGLPEVAVGRLQLREVFGGERDLGPNAPVGYHNPDHPLLGRLWIGICHEATRAVFPVPNNPTPFSVACARTAPAVAFALLVLMVGCAATRWYGRAGGVAASAAVALTPRLFGHAHLAALDTLAALACVAAVLCVAALWNDRQRVSTRSAALAGVVFGIALGTKIQAVLLPVPIGLWALWQWRAGAIRPLLVWGLVGFAVFFVSWPWLWLDPLAHLREYFARTTAREHLFVWYLGRRYADQDVPWHYPGVMFLITVPVGLLILGACGLISPTPADGDKPSRFSPREVLLFANMLFPLFVFSWPGIAVYDGVRLFLSVFSLWALFVGKGAISLLARLERRWSRRAAVAMLGLLLALESPALLLLSPCYLSFYNVLVGGTWGAEKLGFESTYWRDSLTRDFLKDVTRTVPPGSTVIVLPVLHPAEPMVLVEQSPVLRQHRIKLVQLPPLENARIPASGPQFICLFRRKADLVELPEPLQEQLAQAELLAEVRREGVQLAALYRLMR